MSANLISTNIVMKRSKNDGIDAIGSVLFSFFVLICCLFFVYSCAIEPIFLNPEDRESFVVLAFAASLFFLVYRLKQYIKNK